MRVGKTTQNQLSWLDFIFGVLSWFLSLVELDSIAAASYISVILIISDKITHTGSWLQQILQHNILINNICNRKNVINSNMCYISEMFRLHKMAFLVWIKELVFM